MTHSRARACAIALLLATLWAACAATGAVAAPLGTAGDTLTSTCVRIPGGNGWLDCGTAARQSTVAARLYLTLPQTRGTTNTSGACAVARQCHDVALRAATTRQFMDLAGVRRMVAPADPRAAARVAAWLRDAGVTHARVAPLGNAVDAVAPVHVLERLFAAPGGMQYRLHRHSEHPACSVLRAREVIPGATAAAAAFVPPELRRIVYAVRGVVELPPGQACPSHTRANASPLRKPSGPPHGSDGAAPQCAHSFGDPADGPSMCAANLRAAVGMGAVASAAPDTPVYIAVYEPVAQSNLMQGLGAPRFKPQPVWAADPAAEERNNATQCEDTRMSNFGQYCGEASLDMQIIAALTNGSVPSMYVGQNLEHAVTWAPAFDEMHLLTPLPAVVSVSSAYSESFYQGEARGPTYECEDEVQLCTLAARGATVVAGSGDMGASGGPVCGLSASWPCSSPVVTCVGGTMFNGPTVGSEQQVCQAGDLPPGSVVTPAGITAGGGFSDLWQRPAYQDAAVSAWWKASGAGYAGYNTSRPVDPNHGSYSGPNTQGFWLQGRAVPDVSAPAHSFPVVYSNTSGLWDIAFSDGTSASTPVFASMVALVADALWQHAQVRARGNQDVTEPYYLGCINAALYGASASASTGAVHTPSAPASYFLDVTAGNNYCASYTPCCDKGFNATKGYDPAGGWGVPQYDAMLRAFLQAAASHSSSRP